MPSPLDSIHQLETLPDSRGLRLARGQIDLWCFFYEEHADDEALQAAYDALMTDEERARHDRLYFAKDRRMFLATRALARTVLSRYAEVAPAAWRFDKNEHGRPAIAAAHACGDLHFNLSNTRGLVVCAISHGHPLLGVDVENVTRRTETVTIADHFFAAPEVEALKRLPASGHRDRFFCYWTLKESYIKARGMGLALPLRKFYFDLDGAPPIRIGFSPGFVDQPSRWRFELLKASSVHYLALGVAAGSETSLRVRAARVVPLRSVRAFEELP